MPQCGAAMDDLQLRDAIIRLSRSNIVRHPTRTIASGVALAVIVLAFLVLVFFIFVVWPTRRF